MKELRFRLIFDGDEVELAAKYFELDHRDEPFRFKSEQLVEAEILKHDVSDSTYNEITNYFGFPGFLLYCLPRENRVFFVLYRENLQKHQLYDRGFMTY